MALRIAWCHSGRPCGSDEAAVVRIAFGSHAAGSVSANHMRIVVPWPSVLSTHTRPPCSSVSSLTSESPMPVPPVARVAAAVGLIEPIEDAQQVRLRDADAVVGHRQLVALAGAPQRQRDATAAVDELGGVAEHVEEDTLHQRRVRLDERRLGGHLDR